ncbi:MAG: HDOD domain-containing protein [Tissierellaceae bacterium]|nr:HDOD domain-containing protein [Tissierellaceae bacterium]
MEIFLARQPIFDVDEGVFAYEILYRSGKSNAFDGTEGDKASSEVIVNTFQTFGIENLSNQKPVFINFTENLIHDEVATLFPKELLVVELLEDIEPTKEIVEKCEELKKMGYKIALDDFLNLQGYDSLVELADIIKIDFMAMDREEIRDILLKFRKYDIEYLAEKVETRDEFEFAKTLGFKYYQGYFFSKPEIMSSKKLVPIKANYLQLVDIVNKKEGINFGKMAKIISRDLSLTYNLLRLVNSAAFGFRYKINTVKHGLVGLGEREIRKWIHLIVLNDMGSDRPDELTRQSLVRARFLELIALKTKFISQSEDLFMVGLFSMLDVILKRPLENILEEIKATETVKEVLLKGNNELETLYNMARLYEKGQWDEMLIYANHLNIDSDIIVSSYVDSLIWYNMLIKERL